MYSAVVAVFFTAIKVVNFRLHAMFDLGEIIEKKQASLTADAPRTEDGDEGSGVHDGNQHRYLGLFDLNVSSLSLSFFPPLFMLSYILNASVKKM